MLVLGVCRKCLSLMMGSIRWLSSLENPGWKSLVGSKNEFSLIVFVESDQLSESDKERLALIAEQNRCKLEIGNDRIAFYSDMPIEENEFLAEISSMREGNISTPVIDPEYRCLRVYYSQNGEVLG